MGAPVVPRLTHEALLYESESSFLSPAARFCLDGLAQGEKVLAVLKRHNMDLLRGALESDAAAVEWVPADEWYEAPGRTLAAYHRYVEQHTVTFPAVRLIGEPGWRAAGLAEEAEWTRYESMINLAFARSSARILCAYDARTQPERVIADVPRTHPLLRTETGTVASDDFVDPADFTHAADHLPLPPPPPGCTPIPFDRDLSVMRARVTQEANRLGVDGELRERLMLAVNEVVTNAVEHGGGHGEVRLWFDAGTLLCEVTDPGLMKARCPGYVPPARPTDRGHGLWVVRQLCELLEIRANDTGTCVRLHLR